MTAWLALAHAAPSLTWEVAASGSMRSRLAEEPADLVLLVVGEHRGDMAPCGCEGRPLGGVARAVGYRDAVARRDGAVLLAHAGHWADDGIGPDRQLRGDVVIGNLAMSTALTRFDLVHVGPRDLPWWEQHRTDNGWSASVGDGDAPLAVHRTQVDGTTVAFVAVSQPERTFFEPALAVRDPVLSLAAILPDLDADVVVVVALGLGRRVAEVAELPVHVIVDAGGHRARWAPELLGDVVWVRTIEKGQAVSEVRLDLDAGALAAVTVRSVDLDERVAGPGELERLGQRASRDKLDWQRRFLALP